VNALSLASLALAGISRLTEVRRAVNTPDICAGDDAPGGQRVREVARARDRLQAGDQAYLIGPYEELLAVLRRDRPVLNRSQID
jgi:hypothetical protein